MTLYKKSKTSSSIRYKHHLVNFAIALSSAFYASGSFAVFEGTYWIKNLSSGDHLRVPNTETFSDLETVSSTNNGVWTQFELIQNGSYYHIRNVDTGNFIRPRDENDFSAIYSVPNTWTGDWTQWSIQELNSGSYRFVNRATGKYMGPSNGDDFAKVTQRPLSFTGDLTAWDLNSTSGNNRFAELESHIQNQNLMTIDELETWATTFISEAGSLYRRSEDFAAAASLIELYERTKGPLFTSQGVSSFNASWDGETDLNRALARAVFRVYLAILDSTNSTLIATSPELVDGLMFRSTENFPGSVPNPTDSNAIYGVRIDASLPKEFGSEGGYSTNSARRMTGAYLAPGTIAEVTVPQELVGAGYRIRVGGHSWDLNNKANVNRLYRVSKAFDINDTVTKVANPMGGNIYIEVPVGADRGIVDVQFRNTIRAPFFSARSFDKTSQSEWENVERNHSGAFADIESEHSMWTVPSKWITDLDYDELIKIIEAHDKNIQVASEYVGKNANRHKAILYMIVDTQIRGNAFSIGYPQSNYNNFSQNSVRDPMTLANAFNKVLWHEHGHAELVTMFPDESESHVHMLAVAIGMENNNMTLQEAFGASLPTGPVRHTTSNTLNSWVLMNEFLNGQSIRRAQGAYHPRGHADYAEYVEMFGLVAMKKFNRQINIEMNGLDWDTDWTEGRNNHNHNARILRLSRAANVNVTPLFHLWGHPPSDALALANAMEVEGLEASVLIYDRMLDARNSVPLNQEDFDFFYSRMRAFLNNSKLPWNELSSNYDVGRGQDAIARIDELINLYFPNGRPEAVIFHDEESYQGASFQAGEGTYTIADLKNSLVGNDAISSIQIPEGLSVTVYPHGNAGGNSVTYTVSMPALGTLNNAISHVEISRR